MGANPGQKGDKYINTPIELVDLAGGRPFCDIVKTVFVSQHKTMILTRYYGTLFINLGQRACYHTAAKGT